MLNTMTNDLTEVTSDMVTTPNVGKKTDNLIYLIPEMIPLREASRRTGLSYDCLRKLCLKGKIVHIRVNGTKFLVNYQKLIEYLNTGDQEEGVEDE